MSASDGEASVTDVFELSVSNANDAPTLLVQVVGVEDRLYLELRNYDRTRTYVLWESRDLVSWQVSKILSVEIETDLRFEITNRINCFYRIEISD